MFLNGFQTVPLSEASSHLAGVTSIRDDLQDDTGPRGDRPSDDCLVLAGSLGKGLGPGKGPSKPLFSSVKLRSRWLLLLEGPCGLDEQL